MKDYYMQLLDRGENAKAMEELDRVINLLYAEIKIKWRQRT